MLKTCATYRLCTPLHKPLWFELSLALLLLIVLCIVLCCTALYSTTLLFTALYCAHCTVLRHIISCTQVVESLNSAHHWTPREPSISWTTPRYSEEWYSWERTEKRGTAGDLTGVTGWTGVTLTVTFRCRQTIRDRSACFCTVFDLTLLHSLLSYIFHLQW